MKKKLMFFGGPMNKDTSEQYMENGQKLHVDNMRFTDKGGAAQDIIGNSEVVNAGLPAGINICSHAHAQGDYIYYFIWNSNSDHQIWQHRYDTGLFELVLQDALINPFVGGQTSARQIGDMLYWTDGFFESYGVVGGVRAYTGPRKLNITKSVNYQTSGGSDPEGYPSMDEQTMDLIKWPPASKPLTEYQTDTTRKSNEIYQKLFQFTYRYIYDDHETSVWSQYSAMILPDNHEGLDGRRYDIPESDNNIQITIDTGHHTVRKIQIASRVGNFGAFGIFTTIDKDRDGLSDDVAYDVNFYGDEAVEIVDNQTLRNYDTVPQTANMLEAVNGNTLVLAHGIEGFDKEDIDASIVPSYRMIETISSYVMESVILYSWTLNTPVPGDISQNFFTGPNPSYFYILIDPSNLPEENLILSFSFINLGGDVVNVIYETIEEDSISVEAFGQNLASAMDYLVSPDVTWDPSPGVETWNPSGFGVVIANPYDMDMLDDGYTQVGSTPQDGVDFPPALEQGDLIERYAENPSYVTATKTGRFRGWKHGTHHPIGIVYTDRAKRDGTVNIHDDMRCYVLFPTELDYSSVGLPSDSIYRNILKFSINHQPPEWAVKYHFVYQGNSRVLNFQQRMAIKVGTHNLNRVLVSLEKSYEDIYTGADISHQIKKGDVLRIITSQADVDNVLPLPVLDDYYEFNILEYLEGLGEDGSDGVVIEVFDFNEILIGLEAFMVEIYTPRDSTEEALWFELGDDYDVINPHTLDRVHQGYGLKNQAIDYINSAFNTIVVNGDFGFMAVGGIVTISNSASNNGDYTISSVSYNPSNNLTVIITVEAIPVSEVSPSSSLLTGIQNQDISGIPNIPAQGYLENGDCYHRERPQGTGFEIDNQIVNVWVQDFSFSDYYVSNWYNKGRPMVFDVNARQETRTGLFRNSQKYLDNTLINGLSTFYGGDQAQVQENFGPLYGMVQVGQTLKYFQSNKIGSIYIGQEEITNADGSKQLITSNKVLGTIRPHEEPYGSKDYLSILKVDRDVYFYDREKSVFGKVTPGGIVDLSALGMKTWFRDKTDDFVADTKVACVHDRRNGEVLIVFTTRAELIAYPGRTALGFNYQKNEFTSFQSSLGVEMLVGYEDDRLFSWKDGKMYRHDDGDVREFYGTKVESEMIFIFNDGPDRIKTMKGIGMNSDRGVILEEVEVLPSTAYPNGMMSRIKKESFRAKEGGLFADYRRDMNDPNFTNGNLALISGRELRGYLVKHKIVISEDTTERVTLQNVTIYYHESGN